MKRRSEAKGPPSADLLVCFPSRAHLTLMPKPICSPARPSESNKRRHHHHHHHHKKPAARGAGQASPLLWAKTKPMEQEGSEPTSPKVTCAGQIKVRHKTNACKSWQSVMEEIEKIHNSRKSKRRPTTWLDSIGFKKDVMQFLTCLRNIRLDFRCFGAFPPSEITTDDEDDDDDDPEDYNDVRGNHVKSDQVDNDESSRTVFSKWFMVLQENQNKIENSKGFAYNKEERKDKDDKRDIDDDDHGHDDDGDDDESDGAPVAPPPNALLLMRCRSAPAKTWLEEKEEEENKAKENEERKVEGKKSTKNLRSLMDEEKRNNENNTENNSVVMTYNTDFNKLSSDIAKETWIVGGMKDLLSRSRSWKR